MQHATKKTNLLFITWQHLHLLTQQSETTCRQNLKNYCQKYGVQRLNIYHLCQEFNLTREQLYFHLNL